MRLKHRQRETPFTTRIDPRFRDIQKFNDSISFPNSPEMIILTWKSANDLRRNKQGNSSIFQRISTKILTVLLNRIIIIWKIEPKI